MRGVDTIPYKPWHSTSSSHSHSFSPRTHGFRSTTIPACGELLLQWKGGSSWNGGREWLPCSGHVQEQKRLPPWLANDSTCGLQGSRLPWGFMLRACLCGVRARVHAGSCREANMTLSDCLCHACLCLCCMRARVCNLPDLQKSSYVSDEGQEDEYSKKSV